MLERNHAEVQADFQAIFDGGGTREQMESMSLAYYRTLFQDDEYSLLWGEAKLQAARDAKFRVRFNQFLHGKRLQMAEFIRRFSERAGTPLLLPAETLAFGLMCLCDGVQSYYWPIPARVGRGGRVGAGGVLRARGAARAGLSGLVGHLRHAAGDEPAGQRSPVIRRYASSSDVL